MSFQTLLAATFQPYATLSQERLDQLSRHYDALTRWNERLNLTSIASLEEAVRLHYCESLFLATALPDGRIRMADVGSGAGFPGVPVAVLRPECEVLLIESHQRKAVFLREATRGISNVTVIAQRAEETGFSVDWMISRAVNPAHVLSLGLAPQAAILMSLGDLRSLPSPDHVISLPWGKDHVIAKFHVKHDNIDKRGKGHRDHQPEGRRGQDDDRH